MECAIWEIGTKHDERTGEPLFLADGKLVGTVADVKARIERFESTMRERELEEFAGITLHLEGMRPATINQVRLMIEENNRAQRMAYQNGAR